MYGPSPAERIAMARRLLARNRLQEAVDLLNEAVRQDPRFPDTYEARAEAFEMMGMFPHAAADRRKASDLRTAYQPAPPPPPPSPPPPAPGPTAEAPQPEPEPTPTPPGPEPLVVEEETKASEPEIEPEPEGEPDAVAEVLQEAGIEEPKPVPESESAPAPVPSFIDPDAPRAPVEEPPPPEPETAYEPPPQYQPEPEHGPVVPAYVGPPRPSVSGAMLRAASVVLFALGVFIAAAVGIYMAVDAIGGDDDPLAVTTATPTGDPASTDGGAQPTDAAPPATVEEALRGDPFGFSSVQTAWETAGFAVTVGEFSEEVTGFSEPAVDVTISREGLSMQLSVLMYDGTDIVQNDWSLSPPVSPRLEGVVPVGSRAWYNLNVVVVVRSSDDDTVYQDALDAFIDIG